MHYGKAALKILAVLGGAILLLMVLRPGGGSPWRVLVGPLVLLCPPLALGFSIAGVMRDEQKWHAAVALLISGAITLYFLWAMGLLQALFCGSIEFVAQQ